MAFRKRRRTKKSRKSTKKRSVKRVRSRKFKRRGTRKRSLKRPFKARPYKGRRVRTELQSARVGYHVGKCLCIQKQFKIANAAGGSSVNGQWFSQMNYPVFFGKLTPLGGWLNTGGQGTITAFSGFRELQEMYKYGQVRKVRCTIYIDAPTSLKPESDGQNGPLTVMLQAFPHTMWFGTPGVPTQLRELQEQPVPKSMRTFQLRSTAKNPRVKISLTISPNKLDPNPGYYTEIDTTTQQPNPQQLQYSWDYGSLLPPRQIPVFVFSTFTSNLAYTDMYFQVTTRFTVWTRNWGKRVIPTLNEPTNPTGPTNGLVYCPCNETGPTGPLGYTSIIGNDYDTETFGTGGGVPDDPGPFEEMKMAPLTRTGGTFGPYLD